MITKQIQVELVDHMGKDDTAAFAAWVSTGKDKQVRTQDQIVTTRKRLVSEKHLSCFEHNIASFEIDCPIFIARQILRSRTFSYNELSGRYKDFSDRGIYLPEGLTDEVRSEMILSCSTAFEAYKKLRADGVDKEVARMVLPLNTMTRFKMTGNLRNWWHFLGLRLTSHAQLEARMVANQVRIALNTLWPESMQLWQDHIVCTDEWGAEISIGGCNNVTNTI